MAELGETLSDLLRANGVPGPILHIEGGPHELTVRYYLLNDRGEKYFDDDGEIAMGTVKLDLRQRDASWDKILQGTRPTSYASLEEFVRATEQDT